MANFARATSELPARRSRTRAALGACALTFATCVLPVQASRAQDAQLPHTVTLTITPAGEDARHVATRIRELSSALSVQVLEVPDTGADAGSAGAPLPEASSAAPSAASAAEPAASPIAHLHVVLAPPSHVDVQVRARAGQVSLRRVPLDSGRVDEPAREAIATVCASSVQALIDRQTHDLNVDAVAGPQPLAASVTDDAHAAVGASTPAPSAPLAVAQPAPPSAPPDEDPAAAEPPDERRVTTASHAAASSADASRDPRASSAAPAFVALGYELFVWGGGRVLHGPRLHARYARALQPRWRLGVGVEGAFTWPSTAAAPALSIELSTWSLRALAELAWRMHAPLSLELGAGIGVQHTTGEGSAGAATTRLTTGRSRSALAFMLRAALHVQLSRAWHLRLGPALELLPMQISYGITQPTGFAQTLSSAHVRPAALLELGAQL